MAGFTFVPLVGSIAPLLLLPIAARVGGVDGWYSLSVGQAVGTFGSIAISYGWNVLGPALIATSKSEKTRRAYWTESLRERLVISVIVIPITCAISIFLASAGYELFTACMTLAFCLVGLSPNWFFIGAGDPGSIARFEMLPRLIATLLAAVMIAQTNSLWSYPVLWVLSAFVGLACVQRKLGNPRIFKGSSMSGLLLGLRKRLGVALIDGMGGVYTSAPVPLAGANCTTLDASTIASADKLYRFGLLAVTTVGNTLQGWTLDPSAKNRMQRQIRAIGAHVVLGVVGMVGLGILGEFATALLFGSEVRANVSTMWCYGGAFLAVSFSTPLIRNILIPAGKTRFVLVGTAVGAVVGVVVMMLLGRAWGSSGVALGFMLSEIVMVLTILPSAMRQLLALRTSVAMSQPV
ncbi:hypothetical protein [Arthrobacter sp. efr-133-TYG-118]|uniref:hypothetical protein n=1 Tax=Arthrobacter sp. efr-133-TYG-118 TaxID=3040279 RepID=UPI00254DC1CA|nr:hypothetical protein [Arthrobacter sp. efr-133-TYG-118]